MAYTKQTWSDNDPTLPVSAARMGHIEDGIAEAPRALDAAANKIPVGQGASATWLYQLLVNANVDPAAAIAYTKLALSNSVVNADIAAAAAIARSKLDFGSGLVNADIAAAAAIAYSKLNLGTSIVNADVNAAAAIAYSKLNLALGIVNGDVAAAAAIAISKLADPGSGNVIGSLGSGAVALKPPGYRYSYVEETTNKTSTATTAATATTILTAAAVTFDGSTQVEIEYFSPHVTHSVAGTIAVLEIYDGSTDITVLTYVQAPSNGGGMFARAARTLTPSAGSHTYSIRLWSGGVGTATANAGAGTAGVLPPAYINITKA